MVLELSFEGEVEMTLAKGHLDKRGEVAEEKKQWPFQMIAKWMTAYVT